MDELVFATACEQRRLIGERAVSAVELLDAHLSQIERVNPIVTAIVTLDIDGARVAAQAADAATTAGGPLGQLHGLPVAHKDLANTKGIRTTFGSPVFADHVPTFNDLHIDRVQAAGAITIGKTNTPEFGAGSQTFNTVFGATLNPWDTSRTCGGSSGGAAVALATGMVPLADGSDMGGSLRNPASFSGIVGLRPTPGRVPSWPDSSVWSPWGVEGPMGRTVADVALLLSAMAGPDARSPLSRPEPGSTFADLRFDRDDLNGVRVGFDLDLGGLPVDPAVRQVLAPIADLLAHLGAQVDDNTIDLSKAGEVFQIMRAASFEAGYGPLVDRSPELVKDTIRWNVEAARTRPLSDMGWAIRTHGAIHAAAVDFFANHDLLVTTTVQVPPFDIVTDWVRTIDGHDMGNYIEWMRSCSDITTTGCPAISIPAGFTPDGLPVGVQLVAAHGHDAQLLQLAAVVEAAIGASSQRPAIAS